MPLVIRVLDSITKLGPQDAGCVAVAASHGGRYAGAFAACRGVAAAIVNDAGLGLDQAGIAALPYLQALGIPAAAVDHRSSRIGDGADMMAHGIISHANTLAVDAGCRPGMTVRECARRLQANAANRGTTDGCVLHPASPGNPAVPDPTQDLVEARIDLLPASPVPVLGLDSVSLLRDDDVGTIAVTASHGGLQAASYSDGVRPHVLAVSFHDAGGGKDDAGFSRLSLLQARGIAAVTVAADSARIGDARSCYETGRISRANPCAVALGAYEAMPLKDFVAAVLARTRPPAMETQRRA